MNHINTLQRSLKSYFTLSHHRLECLCQIIVALLATNDVNLCKIARAFSSDAKLDSSYKRLQRFMKGLNFSFHELVTLILNVFPLPDKLSLAIDRTNWKFGKENINILTAGIVYKGIAIPFLWACLPKRGNSNSAERISFMETLLTLIPIEQISTLLADREFIGKDWLPWLVDNNIPFVVRVKENICAANAKGMFIPLKVMLRGIMPGKTVILPKKRLIMGCKLYIIATRLDSGELLIVLTNDSPELALERYATRWEIETLFSALKKRGFNFENTHLSKPTRISNLMFVLSLAFIWSYRQGEIINDRKKIRVKKHGYPAKSIFRVGLEYLAKQLFNLGTTMAIFCIELRALFRPPETSKDMALIGGVL